jgi:hypothetical protein
MATTYKTPGVYVEEIPKFPPSIAPVETAIPAFIGYTDKAKEIAEDDLHLKPKRIGSMVQYEQFFGSGPRTIVDHVEVDDKNNFISADARSEYYMYDSLRLFFSNGGGDCYIVSIELYNKNLGKPSEADFINGIQALAYEDSPTLILFPDAVLMDANSLGNVQVAALSQCADLYRMDRFTIMDMLKADTEADTPGSDFKKYVGMNNLSYGAVYAPWIKTKLPKNVSYSDIIGKIIRNGAVINLASIIPDEDSNRAALLNSIDQLDKINADIASIANKNNLLNGDCINIRDKFNKMVDSFNQSPDVPGLIKVVSFLKDIFLKIDDLYDIKVPGFLLNDDLKTSITNAIKSHFKDLLASLIQIDVEAASDLDLKSEYTAQFKPDTVTNLLWGNANFVSNIKSGNILTGANDIEKSKQAVSGLKKIFVPLESAYTKFIIQGARETAKAENDGLEDSLPVFKSIISGISTCMCELPPSGAIAGVYANTDRTRGVWKAPANISLNDVSDPTKVYSKTQLENLNVDPNTGKSINAIRPFLDMGTLIYGARTLAGNDNEWRYINVRRFFIFVEESTKKSTGRFVFEPNDANTWVKVQAMIENFLTVLWRQGALQGVKPEHAFYVAVGLGKTMTPLDILEGRMIIEIGMAVVRPAEFIILRFSHKMAES